jgi:Na+/H+ antiporter NhaD/arsenite permease-like protein
MAMLHCRPRMTDVVVIGVFLFVFGITAALSNIVSNVPAVMLLLPDWRTHARVGIPVTVLTLAIAGAWLALTS